MNSKIKLLLLQITGIILTACTILLLIITAVILKDSIKYQRSLARAKNAQILNLKLDLTKPGTYTGKMDHIFGEAHALLFEFITEPNAIKDDYNYPQFAGLSGHIRIISPDGIEYAGQVFDANDIRDRGWFKNNAWVFGPAISFFGSPKLGICTVEFKFDKPVTPTFFATAR